MEWAEIELAEEEVEFFRSLFSGFIPLTMAWICERACVYACERELAKSLHASVSQQCKHITWTMLIRSKH